MWTPCGSHDYSTRYYRFLWPQWVAEFVKPKAARVSLTDMKTSQCKTEMFDLMFSFTSLWFTSLIIVSHGHTQQLKNALITAFNCSRLHTNYSGFWETLQVKMLCLSIPLQSYWSLRSANQTNDNFRYSLMCLIFIPTRRSRTFMEKVKIWHVNCFRYKIYFRF